MWDLEVFFFQPRTGDTEGEGWPGFWAGRAPKQVATTRRRDALWVYVRLVGNALVSPRAVEQLAEQAAEVYFRAKGSVTGALRQAVEAVHQRLARANRRLAPRGFSLQGQMVLAVWRGSQLYLAWVGPWHVLLLEGQAAVQTYGPDGAPGLGVGEAPALRFAQGLFRPPVAVLVTDDLEGWKEEHALGLLNAPEATLRTWLEARPRPRCGLLAWWQPGTYHIERRYLPLDVPVEAFPPAMAAVPPAAAAPSTTPAREETEEPAEPPAAPPAPVTPAEPAEAEAGVAEGAAATSEPDGAPAVEAEVPAPRPRPVRFGRDRRARRPSAATADVLTASEKPPSRFTRLGTGMARSLARLLRWQVPTRPIVWLSLLLPLLVSAFALSQYLRQGRQVLHQQWLALAYEQAQKAVALPDPYQRGPAMEEALKTLDRAETYGRSEASEKLRQEMETWLERWEGIRRLDFQPVLTAELPPDIRVQRLLPGSKGLYALDTTRDMVWYFERVSNVLAFEHVPNFRCLGSQAYGGLRVGALVDIARMAEQPASGFEVAAFDREGQWVWCSPTQDPQPHLLPMPTTRWGEIYRTRTFQGDVYILDRKVNNVFVVNLSRPQAAVPASLFPSGQAPDLSQVVDFVLLRRELYFLMVDGQILHCTFQLGESPSSQCEPMAYQDRRPEREGAVSVLPNTRFVAMDIYTGPEPGLLLLDAERQAIYRFTLKLRFVAQYRPSQPWAEEPQAFTVGAIRGGPHLYVMVGPELYAAELP